jgi:transcriptional regulator with XRE-family HTH domain
VELSVGLVERLIADTIFWKGFLGALHFYLYFQNAKHMRPKNRIGICLKKLRTARDITRQEMADYLDISVRWYSKIENCQEDIKLGDLYKICERLSLELIDFLKICEKNLPLGDNNTSYYQAYSNSHLLTEPEINLIENKDLFLFQLSEKLNEIAKRINLLETKANF